MARHQFSSGDEVIVSLGNPFDKKAWKGTTWGHGDILGIFMMEIDNNKVAIKCVKAFHGFSAEATTFFHGVFHGPYIVGLMKRCGT